MSGLKAGCIVGDEDTSVPLAFEDGTEDRRAVKTVELVRVSACRMMISRSASASSATESRLLEIQSQSQSRPTRDIRYEQVVHDLPEPTRLQNDSILTCLLHDAQRRTRSLLRISRRALSILRDPSVKHRSDKTNLRTMMMMLDVVPTVIWRPLPNPRTSLKPMTTAGISDPKHNGACVCSILV